MSKVTDLPKHPGPPYRGFGPAFAWKTQSLFIERCSHQLDNLTYCPPFSLHDDRLGLINFRRTFVELQDPTGYKWAMKYLGDWAHWIALMKCKWFQEALEVAVSELNIKLKSEAFSRIKELAGTDTAQALQASKFIATEELTKKTRGRPSKIELDAELRKEVERLSVHDEDMVRIGLKVIEGGKVG